MPRLDATMRLTQPSSLFHGQAGRQQEASRFGQGDVSHDVSVLVSRNTHYGGGASRWFPPIKLRRFNGCTELRPSAEPSTWSPARLRDRPDALRRAERHPDGALLERSPFRWWASNVAPRTAYGIYVDSGGDDDDVSGMTTLSIENPPSFNDKASKSIEQGPLIMAQ